MKSKLQTLAVLTLFIFISSSSFSQSLLMPNIKSISANGVEFLMVIPANAEKGRPELIIGDNFKPLKDALDPNNIDNPSWSFKKQEVILGEKTEVFYSISCNSKYLYQGDNYESMHMMKEADYKKIYETDETGKNKTGFNDFMRYMYKLVAAEDGTIQLYYYNGFSKKVQLLNVKGYYHGTPVKLILWKK